MSTNRAKIVFRYVYSKKTLKLFFLLIMGGVHTFLISGYKFWNELISTKDTSCAKINTPVSMIVYIKKWLFKEMVTAISKTTQQV